MLEYILKEAESISPESLLCWSKILEIAGEGDFVATIGLAGQRRFRMGVTIAPNRGVPFYRGRGDAD
jgi:hypothetical protein